MRNPTYPDHELYFPFVSAVNKIPTRGSVSELVKFCLFPSYSNIYHFTITSHSFRFVLTGCKRTFSDADLWDLGDSFQASNVVTRAKGSWKQEQTKCFKYESHCFGILSKLLLPLLLLGIFYSTYLTVGLKLKQIIQIMAGGKPPAGYSVQVWVRISTRDCDREQIQLEIRTGLELRASE